MSGAGLGESSDEDDEDEGNSGDEGQRAERKVGGRRMTDQEIENL